MEDADILAACNLVNVRRARSELELSVLRHFLDLHMQTKEESRKKREPAPRKFRCNFLGCGRKFALQEYLQMHQANFGHAECAADALLSKPTSEIPGLLYCAEEHVYYEKQAMTHQDSRRPEFKNVCKLCSSSFIAHKNLQRHMESAHPAPLEVEEDSENGCKDCGKRFSSRYNLERHIQLHRGVRYPCTVCGKVYTQKYAWGQHMKIAHKDWKEGRGLCAGEVN